MDIADGFLEIKVICNSLIVNRKCLQLVSKAMVPGYGGGNLPDQLMYETITFFKQSIYDQMDMVVHQAKCQNHNLELTGKKVDPVHGIDEIRTSTKQDFGIVAIRREMPAVADRVVLAFDDREANPQIGQNDFHNSSFKGSWYSNGTVQDEPHTKMGIMVKLYKSFCITLFKKAEFDPIFGRHF
jgi:hypothetical protein